MSITLHFPRYSNKLRPLIPVMTSANTPSGKVTMSATQNFGGSIGSDGGYAWNVFDGKDTTGYFSWTGAEFSWNKIFVQYEFPEPVTFSRIYILQAGGQNTTPLTMTFIISASTDGRSFSNVFTDTATNIKNNTSKYPYLPPTGDFYENTVDVSPTKARYIRLTYQDISPLYHERCYNGYLCKLQIYGEENPEA